LSQLLEYRFFYGEAGDALCLVTDAPISDRRIRFLEAIWADPRDRVVSRRWVAPPERLDQDTAERLRQACSEDRRIEEVWVTGSETTRHDGSSDVTTDLAVVLDPSETAPRDEDSIEIITRLRAAWPMTDRRRGYLWVSRETIARNE